MNHVSEMLDDYIDGVLDEAGVRLVEAHLPLCESCRTEEEDIRRLVAAIHELPDALPVPPGLDRAVDERIRSAGLTTPRSRQLLYRLAAALVLVMAGVLTVWLARTREDDAGRMAVHTDTLHSAPGVGINPPAAPPQSRGEKASPPRPAGAAGGTGSPVTRRPPSLATSVQPAESLSRRVLLSVQAARTPFGAVSGTVTDATTGSGLPGANVLVLGTGRGAVTNASGEFSIAGIEPGNYTIRVSGVGYKVMEARDVAVASDSVRTLALALNAAAIEMDGVVALGTRPRVDAGRTAGEQTFNQDRIEHPRDARGATELGMQAGVVGHDGQLFSQYRPARSETEGEQYDPMEENDYRDVAVHPLSTFSIDVDNASYSNVRRFINGGTFPPPDAVRVEELINYFTYEYPAPGPDHPFSITAEVATCPWNTRHMLMLVGLQGKRIVPENLPPSNLVFLIDVSGSMNKPNKLPLLKSAFRLLVEELRGRDRVAIVVYAGRAGLVLPSTPASDKWRILRAIDELSAGGSTAGGEGIQLAYRVALENLVEDGNNRVILATDGDFNVGITSDEELVRLIEEKRDAGVFLSVLGFGDGNLKDAKMEKLADKGNGNYSYVDNLQEAHKVFVRQMAGTLYTIAKDVKIQIEFNPAAVRAYRLVGYENRMLRKEDFNDDRKDAGEMGAGHMVTALYELVPPNEEEPSPAVDPLKYQREDVVRTLPPNDELGTVKVRYKLPDEERSRLFPAIVRDRAGSIESATTNLRFAAAVAEFGMILRGSHFRGDASFDSALRLAREARGEDADGYRAEFIRLVETCRALPPQH